MNMVGMWGCVVFVLASFVRTPQAVFNNYHVYFTFSKTILLHVAVPVTEQCMNLSGCMANVHIIGTLATIKVKLRLLPP